MYNNTCYSKIIVIWNGGNMKFPKEITTIPKHIINNN